MKKIVATALAFLLTAAASGPALANKIPTNQVNPQQRGHVAYLESLYGEKKAKEIIKDYGRVQQPPHAAKYQYMPYPYDYVWYPAPPISQSSGLENLMVGDYFYNNSQLYLVGRFTVIGNARVLVAYPVNAAGSADYAQPRYFYL